MDARKTQRRQNCDLARFDLASIFNEPAKAPVKVVKLVCKDSQPEKILSAAEGVDGGAKVRLAA
jgi:hypothetical protein